MDLRHAADAPHVLAPSVRHTRRREDEDDYGQGLIERQVTVTNPDGSRTRHTFRSDTHID